MKIIIYLGLLILSVQCYKGKMRIFLFLLFALFSFGAQGQRSDSVFVRFLHEKHQVDFSDNNRVVLFKYGQEKFDDLFHAVKHARESIHLQYFNFRNDSISRLLFQLLAQKAKEGVEVRALFDGFGNSSNDRPLKEEHLKQLRELGIQIYEFDRLKFPWLNHAFHRDHRKIVVIDGVLAYTGGMNVADYYINGKPEFGEWRDLHARVEGDVVADLQGVFLNFWNKVTNECIQGSQYYPGVRDARTLFPNLKQDTTATASRKKIGVINCDPQISPRIIHDAFIEAIHSAQKQIQIISPYFTLCSHTKKALKDAVKRGVDVQIMVSAKSDIPVTPRLVEQEAHDLMKLGAKIYFFEGGFHHSKLMMVDSLYSFFGSANLNARSLFYDYECNIAVIDKHTTHELQRIFEKDRIYRCFQLTDERWKQISWRKRFLGRFFQILTPFV